MNKLIELLDNKGIEVTDDIRKDIQDIWPNTNDLLSQEKVDSIIESRVAREKSKYETIIDKLEDKTREMIEPEKINDLKNTIDRQNKDYALKLMATSSGVQDMDYFEYLIDKKGYKDNLVVENNELFLLEDDDKVSATKIIDDLKEDKSNIFSDTQSSKAGSEFNRPDDKINLTKEHVAEMSENEINDRWDEVKKIFE